MPAFRTNIKNRVVSHGFDSVDIDMAPLMTPDKALFQSFITAMRTSFGNNYLINVAALLGTEADPSIYAGVAGCFDQINVEFTQAPTTISAKTITTSPWGYSTIKNSVIRPVGVTSLHVQIAATGQNWDPQIASLSITHQ